MPELRTIKVKAQQRKVKIETREVLEKMGELVDAITVSEYLMKAEHPRSLIGEVELLWGNIKENIEVLTNPFEPAAWIL